MDNSREKIYFCGSIKGGRDDQALYSELISFMQEDFNVLTAHVGEINLESDLNLSPEEIYRRDMAWMDQADYVVAEVSTPSLGVGFEISRAVSLNKKILCLCRAHKNLTLSAIISGCPNVQNVVYSDVNEARKKIKKFLAQ